MLKRSLVLLLSALLIVSAFVPLAASYAQGGAVTITFAVTDNQRDQFTKAVADFNAANPGIIAQLVAVPQPNIGSAANDINAHLDGIQQLMSNADVVQVNNNNVSPEAVRAGYFLNLQPLIDNDKTINVSDFYPNVWRAFQWDQGTWALPITVNPFVLDYDPAAFDTAKLTYPTTKWTIDDLIAATKALTQVDSSGKVTTPGFELFGGNNDIPLYMSLIGKPLFDANAIPNPPMIDQPEVTALLDKLPDLFAIIPQQSNTFGQAPLRIDNFRTYVARSRQDTTRKAILLPGGHSFLTITGVAVSASTPHPEAAYAFANFLTTRVDAAGGGASMMARQSLVSQGNSANPGGPGGGPGGFFNIRMNADQLALYNDAIANGYSQTDRRFYDYLNAAIRKIVTDKLDTKAAIALAQDSATKAQQAALDRKADTSKVAVVATPVPTLAPDQGITLKFGISAFGGSIPKKAEMQALADQFVKANQGVVGRVDIASIQGGILNSVDSAVSKFDCFYLPYSAVPSLQLDTVLSLDPFTSADKSYDAKDFVGAALAQVQRDNKTWALPMNIAPTVMWYDPQALGNAGVATPTADWQISAFADALKALKPNVQAGNPPFAMQGDAGASLLMLMASYGGLPLDYRTNPPTIAFNDKTNVDAMRQVLDLAKAGLISYQGLSDAVRFLGGDATSDPVYSQQLNGLNFRGGFGGPGGGANTLSANKFIPVPFPKGGKMQAMSYSIGSLYISASAQNADACYKWITLFSQHPELANGMPARQSQLSDPKMETTYGAALAGAYRDVGNILNDPNTINIPSLIDGRANVSSFILQHWLFQAWDNYVLHDKDLDTGLTDAQNFATGYQACTAAIPPYDPAQTKFTDYLRQFADCAVKVDPSLSALRGFLN